MKKKTQRVRGTFPYAIVNASQHTHMNVLSKRVYIHFRRPSLIYALHGCVKKTKQRKRGTSCAADYRYATTGRVKLKRLRNNYGDCRVHTNAIENRRVIVTRACTINIGHDDRGAAEWVLRAWGKHFDGTPKTFGGGGRSNIFGTGYKQCNLFIINMPPLPLHLSQAMHDDASAFPKRNTRIDADGFQREFWPDAAVFRADARACRQTDAKISSDFLRSTRVRGFVMNTQACARRDVTVTATGADRERRRVTHKAAGLMYTHTHTHASSSYVGPTCK